MAVPAPAVGGGGPAEWWNDGQPQTELAKQLVEKYKDELGEVEVTYQENTKLPEALQLAHQSDQMPDVTNIGDLGVPIPQLVEEGWFQPLELDEGGQKALENKPILPGIQRFGDKTYTFPVNVADANCIPWFHLDALTNAGLDPENPPKTYDEFRDACQKVAKNSDMDGLMLPLGVPGTNEARIEFLAQAAGWEGRSGQRFDTGEFGYDSDEWINAIEFLKSLADDKLVFAGSQTATVKDGQARWAGRSTGFFFDGPWIPGNIKLNYEGLQDKVGSGPILVPEAGREPALYTNPSAVSYFIPAKAERPDVANKLMSIIASDEYQVLYAGTMAHMPLDREALEESDAYPIFKEVCARMYDATFQAPSAVVGNVDVARVEAVIQPVEPDAGTIIQGYFSGDVPDIRAAMTKYSDQKQKALDDAIAKATSEGAEVSMDDWVFANWEPSADYTLEMYDAR